MALEIERKFLVRDGWPRENGTVYEQGYLSRSEAGVVRVRIAGEKAFLTIKGRGDGLTRPEYEYEIPVVDAREMLESFCGERRIVKTRYLYEYKGFVWEIDCFGGANAGLVMAEVEMASPDEDPPRPAWIGQEVTGDDRYFNAYLVDHPWPEWATN